MNKPQVTALLVCDQILQDEKSKKVSLIGLINWVTFFAPEGQAGTKKIKLSQQIFVSTKLESLDENKQYNAQLSFVSPENGSGDISEVIPFRVNESGGIYLNVGFNELSLNPVPSGIVEGEVEVKVFDSAENICVAQRSTKLELREKAQQ